MTDPRHAFYRAVEAAPDDDTPRLVFADWLDEHGDPELAAAIRAACAAPHRRPSPVVRERFRGLYKYTYNVIYSRGLPDRINLPADVFVRWYPEVAALGPAHHIKISSVKRHEAALADCPHLEAVRWLSLDVNKLNAAQTATVFGSRHLSKITRLVLNNNPCGNAGMKAVAAATMPALTRLSATSNKLRDAALKALFQSKTLGRVTHWNFGCHNNNVFTADGFRAMAGAPRFADVQVLNLTSCGDLASAAEAIAGSPHAAGLRELTLDRMTESTRGLTALAGSPHLGGLTTLKLNWLDGDPEAIGLRALFDSTALSGLTSLDMATPPGTGHALAALTASRGLPALTELSIGSAQIYAGEKTSSDPHETADAFAAFIRSPLVRRLTRLCLAYNRLGEAGGLMLAKSPAVARLEDLNLSSTDMTDAAVEALVGSPFLTNLKELNLSGCLDLTGRAAKAVCESPILRDLQRLFFPLGKLSADEEAALKARFGPALNWETETPDADGD